MWYNDKIRQHYFHARNVGEFAKTDPDVLSARQGSYAAGMIMQIQIKITPAQTDYINDAKYLAFGNPAVIACCSFTTAWLIAKPLPELNQLTCHIIAKELQLAREQFNCAMLAEDVVQALLAKWQ